MEPIHRNDKNWFLYTRIPSIANLRNWKPKISLLNRTLCSPDHALVGPGGVKIVVLLCFIHDEETEYRVSTRYSGDELSLVVQHQKFCSWVLCCWLLKTLRLWDCQLHLLTADPPTKNSMPVVLSLPELGHSGSDEELWISVLCRNERERSRTTRAIISWSLVWASCIMSIYGNGKFSIGNISPTCQCREEKSPCSSQTKLLGEL